MKPESISGRQEATTYVLEYSQNLLRLKEYDPCVLKKRTLLKNADGDADGDSEGEMDGEIEADGDPDGLILGEID
jgi:hypothetical protein